MRERDGCPSNKEHYPRCQRLLKEIDSCYKKYCGQLHLGSAERNEGRICGRTSWIIGRRFKKRQSTSINYCTNRGFFDLVFQRKMKRFCLNYQKIKINTRYQMYMLVICEVPKLFFVITKNLNIKIEDL